MRSKTNLNICTQSKMCQSLFFTKKIIEEIMFLFWKKTKLSL